MEMSEKAGNRKMAGLRQRQNLRTNSTAVQVAQARQTPLQDPCCPRYFFVYEAGKTWKLNINEFKSTDRNKL